MLMDFLTLQNSDFASECSFITRTCPLTRTFVFFNARSTEACSYKSCTASSHSHSRCNMCLARGYELRPRDASVMAMLLTNPDTPKHWTLNKRCGHKLRLLKRDNHQQPPLKLANISSVCSRTHEELLFSIRFIT
jgi:hypothetical protein